MKKKIILGAVLALIIIIGILLSIDFKGKVEIEGETIKVEVPESPEKIAQGLMFRENLCDSCGMLFIFEEEKIWPFWMKNTKIPLNIIHINKDFEIVDVIYAVPCEENPCPNYVPKDKSLYVLEVNGGKFNESIIGNKVSINV